MKKALLSLAFLSIVCVLQAQEAQDYEITFEHSSAKIYLSPAIKHIDESSKFFVQYPEQLSYYKDSRSIYDIRDITYSLKLDAKRSKKKEDADYVFRFSSPGIKISPATPEYVSFERAATYYSTAGTVKGYVYKFRYYFPVTLEVVNKGVVEKVFQFNTDSATMEYHGNFLLDARTTQDYKPLKLLKPFVSEKEATDNFKKFETEIYKRMEYNAWFNTIEYAEQILQMAYSDYKLPESYFYSKVLAKKGKAALPEIAQLVDKQNDLIGDLDDDKKKTASLEMLKQQLNSFDSLISNLNKYGPKVQLVILSNAAWAALLTGQTQKATEYFTQYYSAEDHEYQMFEPYKQTFAVYYEREIISQPAATVEPDNNVDFLTPVKAVADASINIERQAGQVEKNDGEIIKGNISIEYAAKAGGIIDADLGKAATVYFTKNGSETYQIAKVNNTKKITLGERVFEPVTMKKSALVGAFNAASGDIGSTYFMEKMYEKNGFIVYRFWYSSEALFIKYKDQRAIELPAVINERKLAKPVFEACPKLSEWVKTNSLKNNMESAKKIVDFLSTSCQ